MARRTLVAAGAVAVLALALGGCASTSGEASSGGPTRITVASERCGAGWKNPHAGQQEFLLANSDVVPAEVFLVDVTSGDVYAYVDDVAPQSTAVMRVALGSGHYSFRCSMSDEGVARGASVAVSGSVTGTRPVKPVTDNDLIPVVKAYESYVTAALPGLGKLVGAMASDIRGGDLAAARSAWLPAHLAYERLGAAYGAFGDTDTAINGLTAGLARGVEDPSFTGFHRIEYGLWHGQSAGELEPYAARLVTDVASLKSVLDQTSVSTLDIAIRTHEIAENALQFDLTGQTDYGSGSSLASVRAELDGTTQLLTLMTPVLKPRYPDLQPAEKALALAKQDVDAQRIDGRWTPLTHLSGTDRERIDSDVSGLATLLAPVASICEPRITS